MYSVILLRDQRFESSCVPCRVDFSGGSLQKLLCCKFHYTDFHTGDRYRREEDEGKEELARLFKVKAVNEVGETRL